MRILVTGGAGFIGTNLVPLLASAGHEPVIIDDLLGAAAPPPPNLEAYRLTCRELVDTAEPWSGVEAVVHLAGRPSVEFATRHPLEAFEHNVADSVRLLEAAATRGVRRFVFASSNAAVGQFEGAVHEGTVPRPLSRYGASKLAVEAYCLAAGASGMRTTALRFANVYGPHSARKSSVVNAFARAAIEGHPVTIYGDGSQSRDFIYVEDVCRAIRMAVESTTAEPLLQIGTGVETTVARVTALIREAAGALEVRFASERAGDIRSNRSDITLAGAALGWEPRVGIAEGISRTLAYYRRRLPTSLPTSQAGSLMPSSRGAPEFAAP